jgi:hypothetical protein
MHFTSSRETVMLHGITLHGAADTSAYQTLTTSDAVDALDAAEGPITLLFELSGVANAKIPSVLHMWTGKGTI